MSAVRGGARAWLLACVCSAACGDDGAPAGTIATGRDGGVSLDGGSLARNDASLDGGASDAVSPSNPDGNVDLPVDTDASSNPDGGATVPSSDGGALPTAACSFEQGGIVVVAQTGVSPEDPLALSVRNDGASLAWIAYQSGNRRLNQMWFDAANADNMVSADATEASSTSTQLTPSNSATASGFLTVWADDVKAKNVFNLRAQALDASGTLIGAAPSLLTSDVAADQAPALATGKDGNVVVVWQSQGAGWSLLVGADGRALGTVHSVPDFGLSRGRPALAKLGAGYVLAWADATAARRVHLQILDAQGVPVGRSSIVDADGGAQGDLDLATADTGGAVVWDVYVAGSTLPMQTQAARAEVRFRSFDATGAVTGVEHVLTDSPDTGLMPTVIPLRGGFALAYRSIVPSEYQLRLALVDRFGSLIADKMIAPLKASQVSVAMRGSPDGQNLFLAWIDRYEDTTSYELQRTWIHCD